MSRYGESLIRPTFAGIIIIFLSTFFFITQSNPNSYPTLDIDYGTRGGKSNTTHNISPSENVSSHNIKIVTKSNATKYSKFIGLANVTNSIHWRKSFERAIADFLPLLPAGSDTKIGLVDYTIKIVGGAVTFGLIAIALRRRFERKYTR